MKKNIGVVILFVGLAMMFPAPIQLIRYGAGYPNEKLFAQLWFGGFPMMIIGLAVNWVTTPPSRK